nr:response regulator [Sphingomonas sp. Y57]
MIVGYYNFLGLASMRENYGILLVDDEPAYLAIVTALLRSLPVEVDHAADRASAFGRLATRRYDLILVDIQLGRDDGRDVAAELRGVDCPILAFTSLDPAEGERYFTDLGFDGWIAKPFEGSALVAAVCRWLGDGVASPDAPPEGGQLAALLGADGAASMIGRLHDSLAEAVAQIDGGADARPIGHRIGGLTGTLGFPTLSAAWLSLQDDLAAWPTVRALTIEAISRGKGSAPG